MSYDGMSRVHPSDTEADDTGHLAESKLLGSPLEVERHDPASPDALSSASERIATGNGGILFMRDTP